MLTAEQPRDEGGGIMSLGSLFKGRRAQLGLTQKQVADEAEIGLSYYKQIETDRANPTFDKVERLVRVLDIEPRAAFREVNPEAWGDEEEDISDENRDAAAPEVQELVDALRTVQNIFAAKRTSRRLPGAILDAEERLMAADLDELEKAATILGQEFPLPEEEEFDALEDDDQEEICENLCWRFIVAAMYGSTLEDADRETLEAIANDIRDRVYRRRGFIQSKGFFEDEDDYLERLRRELAPHIVEAAKQRKAPDLDNLYAEEED